MSRAQPSAIIIGAGMTGIQLAIKLREQGITDLIILEKADSVGGTWRENTYPGVACDVPGHAYTYSFAPNPEWSRMFAPGDEIHRYFITVAQRYGQEVKLLKFGRMPAMMVIDKAGQVSYKHYADAMSDIPPNQQVLAILDQLDQEEARG